MHCGICEIGLSDLQLPILFWVATVLLFYIFIGVMQYEVCLNTLRPGQMDAIWQTTFSSAFS